MAQKRKAKRPKRGRPPLPPEEVRDRYLRVRISQDEQGRMERAAEAKGLSLSEWARKRLLARLKA